MNAKKNEIWDLCQKVDWNYSCVTEQEVFPLTEFAACVGNLRATWFGRDSAWPLPLFGPFDKANGAIQRNA